MESRVSRIETKKELLRALEAASSRRLTADEVHKQRVSFIMGIFKETSGVTRARVESVLAEQEGR
jgi:hypothetical protein